MNKITKTKTQDVQALMTSMTPAFQAALGSKRMAERFARVALTLLRSNPRLAESSAPSLLGALMQGAQLVLDFGLNEAYLVPYWSNKMNSYEVTFQIGYQGYVSLFYRHPLAQELYAETVYSNDEFRIVKGTERSIHHVPTSQEKGNVIGFYAVARLKTGAFNFDYMTKDEMDAHRDQYTQKTKDGRNNFWDKHYEAMAQKTVVKRVLKLMPKAIDMAVAMEVDGSITRPIDIEEAKNIDSLNVSFIDIGAEDDEPTSAPQKPKAMENKRKEIIERLEKLPIEKQSKEDILTEIANAKTQGDLYSIDARLGIMEARLDQ